MRDRNRRIEVPSSPQTKIVRILSEKLREFSLKNK
jgi:hypothetical protein